MHFQCSSTLAFLIQRPGVHGTVAGGDRRVRPSVRQLRHRGPLPHSVSVVLFRPVGLLGTARYVPVACIRRPGSGPQRRATRSRCAGGAAVRVSRRALHVVVRVKIFS